MNEIRINAPLTKEAARSLRAGDLCLITGEIYTARDAAHKRLCELMDRGEPLPIELSGTVIYFVGPTPTRPGEVIGSAGPTTSYRMDSYSPRLIERGLLGMIGKGKRGDNVIESMKKHGAVYFGADGGLGALLSRCVKRAEVVAYPDLGAEAISRLYVEDFPVVVVIDSLGNNLYELGRADYLSKRSE